MSRLLSGPSFAAEEARGLVDAARFVSGTLRISESDAGAFSRDTRGRSLVARRALLFLRADPALLWRLAGWAVAPERRSAAKGFLLRLAYWRGVGRVLHRLPVWQGLLHPPIILMYHAVARHGETPSCYVVSRGQFRVQMAWLKWRRYNVLALADVVDHLRHNRVVPPRSVVITFDDGFEDNYTEAYPVLQRYGFPATIFAVSAASGRTAWWPGDAALAGRPTLSDDALKALSASIVAIGAHTRTHPALGSVPAHLLRDEIDGSRAELARRDGTDVRTFAYPFGDSGPAVCDRVREAGFDAACCSRSGFVDPASPLHELPRVEVRGTDSLVAFALMLRRGHRRPTRRVRGTLAEATT